MTTSEKFEETRKQGIGDLKGFRGQAAGLIVSFSRVATDYAAKKGLDSNEAFGLVSETRDLVEALRFALESPRTDESNRPSEFWTHEHFPLDLIRQDKAPYMNRSEIESVTGKYLELPFRWSHLDRLLVDVLVAMELYAFGKHLHCCPANY